MSGYAIIMSVVQRPRLLALQGDRGRPGYPSSNSSAVTHQFINQSLHCVEATEVSVWLSLPSGLPVCFAPNTGNGISTWCGITVSYRYKQMSRKGSAPLSKWQDSSSRIKFYICLLTRDVYHIIPMAFSSICLPGVFVRPQMCLISNHGCCLLSSTSILGFPLNGKPYLFIKDPFSVTQCPKCGALLEQSWCDQNSLSHTSSIPLSSCVSLLCVAVAESEYRTYVCLAQKFWRLKSKTGKAS